MYYAIKPATFGQDLNIFFTWTILLAERARCERPAKDPLASVVTVTASRADFFGGVGRVCGLETRLTMATAGVNDVGGGLTAESSKLPCSTV